jgi:tRNA pseudouridine13 synthase
VSDLSLHPQYLPPDELAYSNVRPHETAVIRSRPEDFYVEEGLGFELEGQGQHCWLWIEKCLLTTEVVAASLARAANIPRQRISYAGMKDRNAVTRQWFSVDLAGVAAPVWNESLPSGSRVLAETWHRRKLRRGGLKRNKFHLVLREISGDRAQIDLRLARVASTGVPNYFGPQRFGRDAGNVPRAWAMLTRKTRIRDRHLRSIYLSTARSLLFNRVLSDRVRLGSWQRPVDGDVMMLDGSSSVFVAAVADDVIQERVRIRDVHPTGPLWGRGGSAAEGSAVELEQNALEGCEAWCSGLERVGLTQDRRALRLRVGGLTWEWQDERTVELAFELPAGGYATSMLREIVTS